jgi:hypothetical protein
MIGLIIDVILFFTVSVPLGALLIGGLVLERRAARRAGSIK